VTCSRSFFCLASSTK